MGKRNSLLLKNVLVSPFQQFFKFLTGGGMLLMFTTIIALIWANSPLQEYYEWIWEESHFEIGFQGFLLDMHIIHWINDGLMVIFFFVVGLEIKRELLAGELSSLKQAALPIFAAIGGMIIPIAIFQAFGARGEAGHGWAIPMATDIAFSIGILSLLGKRVPLSLKVFLTALAIVDDLGAVLVIAIFYSKQINWFFLMIAFVLLLVLIIANRRNVQNLGVYVSLGFVIWVLFLFSGVHATIAGVLVAFTIPARPKVKVNEFIPRIKDALSEFSTHHKEDKIVLTHRQLAAIDMVENLSRKVQSPLQMIEHQLSGFVNYVILPLFAMSNAGVIILHYHGAHIQQTGTFFSMLSVGIAFSMVFGKVLGISLFSWLAVKLKFAVKPHRTSWRTFIGLGFLGGIGFTMSLFIATLSYDSIQVLNQAKIGIFMGSIVAGVIGYFFLKKSLDRDERLYGKSTFSFDQ